MILETTEIAGMKVDTHIARSGTFYIYPAGNTHASLGQGETLDKAMKAARTQIARLKVKVSVPFTTTGGESGVATGLHAKNRTILARVNGNRMQIVGGRDARVFIDIPKDELERYLSLGEQINRLRGDQRAIEEQYLQQLRPLVERAIVETAGDVGVETAGDVG